MTQQENDDDCPYGNREEVLKLVKISVTYFTIASCVIHSQIIINSQPCSVNAFNCNEIMALNEEFQFFHSPNNELKINCSQICFNVLVVGYQHLCTKGKYINVDNMNVLYTRKR